MLTVRQDTRWLGRRDARSLDPSIGQDLSEASGKTRKDGAIEIINALANVR